MTEKEYEEWAKFVSAFCNCIADGPPTTGDADGSEGSTECRIPDTPPDRPAEQ